jgi:predicted deacylase
MDSSIDFGSLAAGRHDYSLPFLQLADGATHALPVTVVVGAQPGPRLAVTAGIHGDEYEGVRAVADLCRELNPAEQRGVVVLVPCVNAPAFNAGMRLSPLDGVNLNRVFPGNADGTPSERLAHLLFGQVIANADALIDLHSGGARYVFQPQAGFYLFPGNVGQRSLGLAQAFGLDLLWELPFRAGVCSHEAMRLGVPSIGVEIGGNGRCEPAHVALAKRGVRNVLATLGMLPMAREASPNPDSSQVIGRGDFTLCPAGGLFEPSVTLNQLVQRGQTLFRVLDLRGGLRYERKAEHGGIVSAIRIFGMIQEGEWDICVLERVA